MSFFMRAILSRNPKSVFSRPLCTSPPSTTFANIKTTKEPREFTEWLVVIPDRPGVLSRRIAIRPRHSPNFVRLHNEGYVSWAGPLFERHVDNHMQRPFKGSVMVVNEYNKDGFMEKIQSDVYVQERVWDLDNAEFIPFRTLMRAERANN
ncbi:hypothetical protein F5884DRAFT_278919 [Xylogone sp. PMI_703]|nr:hypothetical protein F5884DRAFT_278919 [Xylogone sp. PMI_703]